MDSPIQQLVPPVVIISACGLLCMGQFARYTAITGRLRGFHRERIEVITKLPPLEGHERHVLSLRADQLEQQAHGLLKLAKLIRNALLLLVLAVICMIISSMMIGLELVWENVGQVGAVVMFVAGLVCMLAGMVFVFAEVRRSLCLVAEEHRDIEQLALSKSA